MLLSDPLLRVESRTSAAPTMKLSTAKRSSALLLAHAEMNGHASRIDTASTIKRARAPKRKAKDSHCASKALNEDPGWTSAPEEPPPLDDDAAHVRVWLR